MVMLGDCIFMKLNFFGVKSFHNPVYGGATCGPRRKISCAREGSEMLPVK